MQKLLLKYSIMLLLTAGIAASSASCKKDDDDDNTPEPVDLKTERLTAHPWILTSRTIDPPIEQGGTTTGDLMAGLDSCAKDGTITFRTDNKLIMDEGPTKCHEEAPQRSEGTWLLLDNDTKLVMTGTTYRIQSFSEEKMVLTTSFESKGTTYTETHTLVK